MTKNHRLCIAGMLLALLPTGCKKDEIVTSKDIPLQSITLDQESMNLKEGEEARLSATLVPADATERTLEWISLNQSVATVSADGLVKAVKTGVTTIRVQCGSIRSGCRVTVTSATEQTETPENPPAPAPAWRQWEDTGASLPDYPSYNAVSALADFPRVDITWEEETRRLAEGEFTYVNGTVRFRDPKGMYADGQDYVYDSDVLPMRIRGRGNTSYDAENGIKHSYRLKLTDATRSAKEPRRVFGMKKDSDWYLLADVQDPTLLRNALALRLSRMVSMPWTPKFRCVEVYFNGHYGGCYLLVEAKEADRDSKVPVTVVADGETDGGYLLEIDNKGDYDRYFRSEVFHKKIKFKEPDFGDRNNPDNSSGAQAQMDFIMDYVNGVERLLESRSFDEKTGYRSMLDADTFIGNYLVQEVTKNMDGGMRLSTYFAKDSDTRLFMPMVWDFDLTLGNYNDYISSSFGLYEDGDTPRGWLIRLRGGSFEDGDYNGSRPSYYQYLFEDPLFVADLKARWNVVKPRLDKIPAFIEKMVEYNALAYDHNAQAGFNPRATAPYWGYGLRSYSSWRDAVEDMLDFYRERIGWLDTHIGTLKAQRFNPETAAYEDLPQQ